MLPACSDQLCLDSSDQGDGITPHYVLAGVVDGRGEQLDVTDASGATRAYPLRGPLVPETNLRVFMVDLGANDWRRLELRRAGQVLASQEMPLIQARSEECPAQVAPPTVRLQRGEAVSPVAPAAALLPASSGSPAHRQP